MFSDILVISVFLLLIFSYSHHLHIRSHFFLQYLACVFVSMVIHHIHGREGHKSNSVVSCELVSCCFSANLRYRSVLTGVMALAKLLSHKEESILGNAALCLSHCVQVDGVAEMLSKTDIIKELLLLARDSKKPTVQQNCAILIAKLAHGHPK